METVSTPDAQCDPAVLSTAIQEYLASQLGEVRNLASTDLPDRLREVFVLLWMHDMDKHQYLWLQATLELMKVAVSVAESCQNGQNVPVALKARIHDIFGATDRFLAGWNMEIVKNPDLPASVQHYLQLIENACDALVSCQDLLHGVTNVKVLSSSIVRFHSQNESALSLQPALFPVLVSLAKAAYFCGAPETVVPLVNEGIVSEFVVTDLLECHRPTFAGIMDYYRYYAFCFVTLAVSGDSINQEYCDHADVFFRVLLKLPNLHLSNYAQVPGRLELHSHIPEVDREELSFYFLLNEQLRCTTLAQYMRLDPTVQNELRFFLSRFNNRVLKDLAILASPFQSYTSTVSVPSLERSLMTPPSASTTLSTIIFEGTYKEKVNLVLELFPRCGAFLIHSPNNTLQTGNLVSFVKRFDVSAPTLFNQETLHCVNNIDSSRYPGKALYVRALDKIVRLLELLALLHLSDGVGLCNDPDTMITRLFATGHSFRDVASVKNLADTDHNGRLKRLSSVPPLEDAQVAAQLKVLERTRRLEGCVQLLV